MTPSFNQARFLEETILSVLNQDYPNLEYIVIDGGSTDNTVAIIKKYQDRLAYWVSEPDKGQSDAINKGFSIATGEILAWLNSDDVLFPGGVQALVKCFERHPDADFVYGNCVLLDPHGNLVLSRPSIEFDRNILLYGRSLISQPACFMRRATWLRLGPLDERYDFCMDMEYWTRAIMAGAKFKAVEQPVAGTRLHHQTKTSTQRPKLAQQHRMILNQYRLLPFRSTPLLNLGLYEFLLLFYKTKAALKRVITRRDFNSGAATRAKLGYET